MIYSPVGSQDYTYKKPLSSQTISRYDSQIVKIIIVTVHRGASPIKLDLGAGLAAAGHPIQESLELIVPQLAAELTGLGHLTQHGLHLLPLLRLGKHQSVETGAGLNTTSHENIGTVDTTTHLLVQDLTEDPVLHVRHLLGSLLHLLLLVCAAPAASLGPHLGHPLRPDGGQLVISHSDGL